MTYLARKSPPARVGSCERPSKATSRRHCTTQEPVYTLLDRLEGTQQTGQGWRARCPACGGKSRKLAISAGDDGRVLMHCFAGCGAAEILATVGLTLADLFPRRDLRTMSQAEKSAMRQAALIPRWRAALEVLKHEACVIQIAATLLADGKVPTPEQSHRLNVAALRIFDAWEVLDAR